MSRVWDHKCGAEGLSLLEMLLICTGTKLVLNGSIISCRNPEKNSYLLKMHQTKPSLPERYTTKYFVTNIMPLLDRWEEGMEGRDAVKHPKAGKKGVTV